MEWFGAACLMTFQSILHLLYTVHGSFLSSLLPSVISASKIALPSLFSVITWPSIMCLQTLHIRWKTHSSCTIKHIEESIIWAFLCKVSYCTRRVSMLFLLVGSNLIDIVNDGKSFVNERRNRLQPVVGVRCSGSWRKFVWHCAPKWDYSCVRGSSVLEATKLEFYQGCLDYGSLDNKMRALLGRPRCYFVAIVVVVTGDSFGHGFGLARDGRFLTRIDEKKKVCVWKW